MKHAKDIHFGITAFYKKMRLLKNLHFATKNNRTASVFMLKNEENY